MLLWRLASRGQVTKPAVPWSPEAEALEERKRTEVEAALDTSIGNVTVAAEQLGISRSYLNKLLNKFELVGRAKKLRLDRSGRSMGRPRKSVDG